jgi:HSP20 family protein
MNLIPWKSRGTGLDVFADMEDFQKEMNRLFDLRSQWPVKTSNGTGLWAPAVDIIDEKDQIRIKADLPGLKKEDIEVSADNGVLTIKGEKKEEKEVKEKDYVRSERYYGSFHRSFSLPTGVDSQKVNASYKDGVLEITIPKREDAKSKQIKVEVK